MHKQEYLMESDKEAVRIDSKTDLKAVERQALWAGIKPGMRVADIGCSSGKAAFCLDKLVQPGGEVVGLDVSAGRLEYAGKKYGGRSLKFICRNIYEPLDDLGLFDFIWVRFFLEYHRAESFSIIKSLSARLNPGGIICLIDLDNNCMNHFGCSEKLAETLSQIIKKMEDEFDFDPYAGRKLYSFLYDLGYEEINVRLEPHHLIFGSLSSGEAFNWMMKIEVAVQKSGYDFAEYGGGYKEFLREVKNFFFSPGRFIYTPVICCRGRKPLGPE